MPVLRIRRVALAALAALADWAALDGAAPAVWADFVSPLGAPEPGRPVRVPPAPTGALGVRLRALDLFAAISVPFVGVPVRSGDVPESRRGYSERFTLWLSHG
ncbi:hypothetical protein [Micromonospora sp. NPDC047074]|uniref:hypothetical protein n=1 Tax=Micromonospora sp. NPDC047074 TaxID=3154339 RepID=UPI0033CD940E